MLLIRIVFATGVTKYSVHHFSRLIATKQLRYQRNNIHLNLNTRFKKSDAVIYINQYV